ncbi:PRD domain-containing protein [Enterococcus sp.]|uniref:PRD domain-containing protein n=1 Tax=Enterococcus sp. TaxID=35783 RepID=UPI002915C0AB|nr:PRD domain-containing protein [Enterococcus sp.]MDU5334544.1 PRD domain-containing protein [Enterococcus sp.]
MQVRQRLNNNVVLVDDADQQMIVMGKGIGYKAYPGDQINESLIERTFILRNNAENEIDQVKALINEVPIEYIILSDNILKFAKEELNADFGVGMLVSLADHIFSAIDRKKKNIQMISPLHWDIKQLYPTEVKIGEQAVKYIAQELKVDLEDTEATSIAMHFISSGNNYDSIQQAMNFTKIISDIITIIQYHFQIKIDQNSIVFSRLVSHLQYFLIRQVKEISMMDLSDEMIKIVINQYQSSFQCAEKINNYLQQNHQIKASLQEEIYLTMHIERVHQIDEN